MMHQTQAKLITTTLIAALATLATTQAQASCGPANDKNYSLMFSVGGVGRAIA
ncbi:MAG: hypothetical protein KBD39_10800 [Sterolibacterium sp.]|nr:hypothetical protein [Sterolibacterium sp.]MBP9800589.1 hypothetical protein [Sterolibacterium sp.]